MKNLASILIHLLGVSIISVCFMQGRGSKIGDSPHRTILVGHNVFLKLFYISSWVFLFLCGTLALGDGIDTTKNTCMAGVILNLTFYFMSKLLGHILYIEKIRAFRTMDRTPRTRSNIHRIYFLSLFLLLIFFVTLLGTSKSNLDRDMECTNNISPIMTLLFFGYNLSLEASLTVLFLWPLINNASAIRSLHRVALMQILSAFLSLVATAMNVGIIGALSSNKRGQIFILSTTSEVTLNAIGAALLNHYTRELLLEDTPNRTSRSFFHGPLPKYYKVQGEKFYPTLVPSYTDRTQSLSVAPEMRFTLEAAVPKPEALPPALSSTKPRGSYFNFMSSLVSLYSTGEPDSEPQRPGRVRARSNLTRTSLGGSRRRASSLTLFWS